MKLSNSYEERIQERAPQSKELRRLAKRTTAEKWVDRTLLVITWVVIGLAWARLAGWFR